MQRNNISLIAWSRSRLSQRCFKVTNRLIHRITLSILSSRDSPVEMAYKVAELFTHKITKERRPKWWTAGACQHGVSVGYYHLGSIGKIRKYLYVKMVHISTHAHNNNHCHLKAGLNEGTTTRTSFVSTGNTTTYAEHCRPLCLSYVWRSGLTSHLSFAHYIGCLWSTVCSLNSWPCFTRQFTTNDHATSKIRWCIPTCEEHFLPKPGCCLTCRCLGHSWGIYLSLLLPKHHGTMYLFQYARLHQHIN